MATENPFVPVYEDPPQERRDKSPTLQETILIEAVVDGVDPIQSAELAGYDPPNVGVRALSKPLVRSTLLTALDRKGLNDDVIVKCIGKGLKARRLAYHQGQIVGEEPDHTARHKYLTTLLELRGDLNKQKEQVGDSWEEVLIGIRARRSGMVEEGRRTQVFDPQAMPEGEA